MTSTPKLMAWFRQGTLRFEVQALQGWCKQLANISTFSDLTQTSIDKLFFSRMKWFGLEAEVMYYGTLLDRILDDPSLSTRVQNGLLRYVRAIQRGSEPNVSASDCAAVSTVTQRHADCSLCGIGG
jgi:hypothetical protein